MSDTNAKPATKIEIDKSKITLGDMRFMSKMANAKMDAGSMERMFDMLERIVVGGIENIPYTELQSVMEAINTALTDEVSVKN